MARHELEPLPTPVRSQPHELAPTPIPLDNPPRPL